MNRIKQWAHSVVTGFLFVQLFTGQSEDETEEDRSIKKLRSDDDSVEQSCWIACFCSAFVPIKNNWFSKIFKKKRKLFSDCRNVAKIPAVTVLRSVQKIPEKLHQLLAGNWESKFFSNSIANRCCCCHRAHRNSVDFKPREREFLSNATACLNARAISTWISRETIRWTNTRANGKGFAADDFG